MPIGLKILITVFALGVSQMTWANTDCGDQLTLRPVSNHLAFDVLLAGINNHGYNPVKSFANKSLEEKSELFDNYFEERQITRRGAVGKSLISINRFLTQASPEALGVFDHHLRQELEVLSSALFNGHSKNPTDASISLDEAEEILMRSLRKTQQTNLDSIIDLQSAKERRTAKQTRPFLDLELDKIAEVIRNPPTHHFRPKPSNKK